MSLNIDTKTVVSLPQSNFTSTSTSTGSKLSSQPPDCGSSTSQLGAGTTSHPHSFRRLSSSSTSEQYSSKGGWKFTNPAPVWLSTSGRPLGGCGSYSISPPGRRLAYSQQQPPPLPPPPLSPQLVPLKSRLSRSSSLTDEAGGRRRLRDAKLGPGGRCSSVKGTRRASAGQSQPSVPPLRPKTKPPLNKAGHDGRSGLRDKFTKRTLTSNLRVATSVDPACKSPRHSPLRSTLGSSIKSTFLQPSVYPTHFSPILHSSQFSALTQCLNRAALITVSLFVTTVFSIVFLPVVFLAYSVRQIGFRFVSLVYETTCCQCHRPQAYNHHIAPTSSISSLLYALLNRILSTTINRSTSANALCQCDPILPTPGWSCKPIRPLSAAELNWLPPLQTRFDFGSNTITYPTLFTPVKPPLVVVCLRLGAPGLRLRQLRQLISDRLLTGLNRSHSSDINSSTPPHSSSSTSSSSNSSSGFVVSTTASTNRRCSSLTPPTDTPLRLTQCLAHLPTGYVWRECSAFQLDQHVVRVTPQQRAALTRRAGVSKGPIKVERLVELLSDLPMEYNRPQWQVHLLEEFYETDTSEPSDIDSDAEDDGINQSSAATSTNYDRPTGNAQQGHRRLLCRHSGSTGLGSLVVFRLHAALSDDAKALVRLVTNCLADWPGYTNSRSADSRLSSDHKTKPTKQGRVPASRQSDDSATSADSNLCLVDVDVERGGGGDQSVFAIGASSCSSTTTKRSAANTDVVATTTIIAPQKVDIEDDEESEEQAEAAQWWYAFWASSIGGRVLTLCDLAKVVLLGPVTVLTKLTTSTSSSSSRCTANNTNTNEAGLLEWRRRSTSTSTDSDNCRRVYKCALLPLTKLSRLRQVTKASYAEIVASLLAGALRAYHQTVGLPNPPDLASLISMEVPTLPRLLTSSSSNCNQDGSDDGDPLCDNLLRPGRNILAAFSLPINVEGMLPRLWATRQRLLALNSSIDPVCLTWTRSLAFNSLPHHLAQSLTGTSNTSVSLTGIEVVSPFSSSSTSCTNTEARPAISSTAITYQMPGNRRLAYMSLLASKSAELRLLRKRRTGRRRTVRTSGRSSSDRRHWWSRLTSSFTTSRDNPSSKPPKGRSTPRPGSSFRALARHLANDNAGLVYVGGSPVIRVDAWMPAPLRPSNRPACQPTSSSSQLTPEDDQEMTLYVCRDLSVAYTTYAGQLSVSLSASSLSGGGGGGPTTTLAHDSRLELIANAMQNQLRRMCQLLAGRHVPTDRWLTAHHQPTNHLAGDSSASPFSNPNTVVNSSPSLNPTTVWRPSDDQPTTPSSATANNKRSGLGWVRRLSSTKRRRSQGREVTDLQLANLSTEQIQSRLRLVQQQLNAAAYNRASEEELINLRQEFVHLLRELKSRCSSSTTNQTTRSYQGEQPSNPSTVALEHGSLSIGSQRVMNSRSSALLYTSSASSVSKAATSTKRDVEAKSLLCSWRPTKDCGWRYTADKLLPLTSTLSLPLERAREHLGANRSHQHHHQLRLATSMSIGGDFDEDPDFFLENLTTTDEDDDDDLNALRCLEEGKFVQGQSLITERAQPPQPSDCHIGPTKTPIWIPVGSSKQATSSIISRTRSGSGHNNPRRPPTTDVQQTDTDRDNQPESGPWRTKSGRQR